MTKGNDQRKSFEGLLIHTRLSNEPLDKFSQLMIQRSPANFLLADFGYLHSVGFSNYDEIGNSNKIIYHVLIQR